VADTNIGLLFFLALAGLGVYAVMFAGWSSNSKYALLGAVRSTAQTLTYEVFMGLADGRGRTDRQSFNMRDIVEAQKDCGTSFRNFIGFSLCHCRYRRGPPFPSTCRKPTGTGCGLSHRILRHEMGHVLRRRVCGVVVVSAMLVTLFFGGWHPLPYLEFIPPFFWFAGKTAFFIMLFILMRGAGCVRAMTR
jgi:NADH-quinone oxidoreductase subunit H